MKVCLAGGGTGGSVTPLIALAQEIEKRGKKTEFLFIGGKEGPEEPIAKQYKIPFKKIDAGKLRRYFSLKNFSDIIKTTQGHFQARNILKEFKPQIILTAGSYVAVPVVIAGKELGINSFIHQQDYQKGLANRLMSPFASKTTVVFRKSIRDFPQNKTHLTGNPVRQEIFSGNKEKAIDIFKLDKKLPTLLFVGGGTGALGLNKLIAGAADKLTQVCQIIHICGSGKKTAIKDSRYHVYDFLKDDLKEAYAAADLVVSRAGMGVLSELSALGKPSILLPYPKSHQVDNAKMFEDASLVFDQQKMTSQKLFIVIKELITNRDKLNFLSGAIKEVLPKNAARKIVDLVFEELS
ncbi:MAG: undecaprenyldiphospho-muramoylpentapeptide beta-N-acetylglucosaminyltransferase [Patescibacteria group bacterium]